MKIELEYYAAYIQKLSALQVNDSKSFGEANERLLNILNTEDEAEIPPIIYHTIGKDMYKVALNTLGAKNKKHRNSLMGTAFGLFTNAVEKKFKHSYFYLAEMYEKGDTPEGTNLKRAVELYKEGGALEEGRCLFQLALL